MTPTINALLLCALFLCALEETVLSQHGHCTANQCSALFQEPNDFLGAQKRCSESGGKLFATNFKDVDGISKSLPSGLNGMYWLHLEGIRMTADLCLAILLATGQDVIVWLKPCSENLDGFLCQYTFNEPCSVLPVGANAQVSYTTPMGFQVNDSEKFPPGTIAVAEKVGGKYLDSKHLCFSSNWLSAPWNCEVLRGGCEHSCNSSACVCASGQTLHPNKVSCVEDNPNAECAQDCPQDIVAHVPECSKGYRLAPDGKSCVDVNECEEESPCTGEGEECVNTQGHFECTCSDGFEPEDGACVNITICQLCEHMRCDKFNGVYQCVCKKGFRVSPHNPTKCEILCTESSCPASCIKSQEEKKKDMMQCFCPEGYILDINDGTASCTDIDECVMANQCDHKCENFFGGYRCLCDEGYKLDKESRCLSITDEGDDDDGSGMTTQHPIPASPHPAITPSYIKTGSILGIAVFVVLCVVPLAFLVNNISKRCGKFEISTLKHHNIDIFYLHQVTSETYKKLSFDKQFKNDPQIL